MQIRHSMFKKEEGCLQCQGKGTLHAHGHYCRYESPDGSQLFEVSRYCCARCRRTVSVLADNRLPYRSITASELEAAFDQRSEMPCAALPPENAVLAPPAPPPPPSEKKSGCLDRAWSAWNRSSRRVAELFGHLLERTASEDATHCWRSLRETFSIAPMLATLWGRFKTSLLADYRCLKPRPRYGGGLG